jgi:hypothetical protein
VDSSSSFRILIVLSMCATIRYVPERSNFTHSISDYGQIAQEREKRRGRV